MLASLGGKEREKPIRFFVWEWKEATFIFVVASGRHFGPTFMLVSNSARITPRFTYSYQLKINSILVGLLHLVSFQILN